MVGEALTVADEAAWATLCSALAEYHETAVLLRLVVRSAPRQSRVSGRGLPRTIGVAEPGDLLDAALRRYPPDNTSPGPVTHWR